MKKKSNKEHDQKTETKCSEQNDDKAKGSEVC